MAATPDEVIWRLATCVNCMPILPQPFRSVDEAMKWVDGHAEATGHSIIYSVLRQKVSPEEKGKGH